MAKKEEPASCGFADGELEPIATRVAVRFDDVKSGDHAVTPGGIALPQTYQSKEGMETRNGKVVGVGPKVEQCKVGDRVFVMEHSIATGVVRRYHGKELDQVLVLDEGQLVAIFRQK